MIHDVWPRSITGSLHLYSGTRLTELKDADDNSIKCLGKVGLQGEEVYCWNEASLVQKASCRINRQGADWPGPTQWQMQIPVT